MFPGFPVEVGGVAELHASFREEGRTRRCVLRRLIGNPGSTQRTWAENDGLRMLLP